jgi:hypothetical protein
VSEGVPPIVLWRRAILRSELTAAHVRVAIALAEHMNGKGERAKPSVRRLAEWSGCSERTVRDALAALVAAKWIKRTIGGRGAGDTSTFQALFDRVRDVAACEGSPGRVRDVADKGARRRSRSRKEVEREVDPPVVPPPGGRKQGDADALRKRREALDLAGRRAPVDEEV